MRVVPVPGLTASLVRNYLAKHPRRQEPGAPLFPGTRLTTPRPTGVRSTPTAPGAATETVREAAPSASAKDRARRQADALAELTVEETEKRLVLDWTQPLRHPSFYKAVFRLAVLRTNRTAGNAVAPGGVAVPLAPTHLREPVRGGPQYLGAAGGGVDGAREPDDDRTRLHAPLRQGRPR